MLSRLLVIIDKNRARKYAVYRRLLFGSVELERKTFGARPIVTVGKHQPLAQSRLGGGIGGRRFSNIHSHRYITDTRIREGRNACLCGVARAIVDDEQFKIGKRLGK